MKITTKPQKPTFFPKHKLVVKNGQIITESIIMAIADLVWRESNKSDSFYINRLDLSDLDEEQIDFILSLFKSSLGCYGKPKILRNNLYWTIKKSGKNNILIPIRKREGYYYIHNKTGMPGLVSLTTISTKLNMIKTTAMKRLERMTLQDLVKMK